MNKENKEKIEKLKQELLIMKSLKIKPNYAELSRIYKFDRRTIEKYNNGYSKENLKRNKKSKLDEIKNEIKEKLELPGITVKGLYQYFKSEKDIGTYSNFYKYIRKYELKSKKKNSSHMRFETDFGIQLQFDWKEDIKMISKHGEIFEFNIFSATLGASRLHVFLYSKFKTRIDVQRCLVETFEYIGGVTKEILTDNMSSIVDTKTGKFYKEFISFVKDIGVFAKHCKPKHPFTKGKDESANRFMSWLVPYNNEFENEEDLIRIIKEINLEVNKQVRMVKYGKASTGLSEELMLIVDKDFNVEEYVGGVVSPYSDLPKVAIEPSTYKKVGNTWCNSPDLSGFNPESTYYVVYEGSGANETEKIAGRIDRVKAPDNWYYYGSKSEKDTKNDPHWANVVTVTGNNVTYCTWIPRYKYTADENNQVINAEFVSDEDVCKNSNDEIVTLSSDYVLPKSFWFGEDADLDNPTKDYANLNGYWLSKYEVQDIELPELEQITQERHKNSIEISTIRSNANLQNGTIEGPSGRYRIYVEGVEVEAKDYNKSTGVTLPYTIKGLGRTKKYDICVESIDRNKMIGRTTGLSSNNIKVDKSGFNPSKTYYVTYEKDKNGNEVEKIAGRLDAISEPENWYNYDKKIWANLVTVNEENITYWTYIPRYEYREVPGKEEMDVKYIPVTQTSPDPGYTIPKSFRFGDDGDLDDPTKTNYIELKGYWLSKYEVQQ